MPSAAALDALRARIASLEQQAPAAAPAWSQGARVGDCALSFGAEALDRRFPAGGLSCGAHEMAGSPGERAPALLFAVLLTVRRFKADPCAQALVVQEAAAIAEAGGLYGPGVQALGLDPGRLVCATARDGPEALRIVDEAVRSGAVAVVLAELGASAARRLDLAATQRFNVFAQRTATLTLLVTPDLTGTSAALTRWRVRAAPSRAPRAYLGPPALDLDLVRNRLGRPARLTLEWSSDDEAFRTMQPLRAPVAAAPVHRPGPAHARPDRPARVGGGGGRRLAAAGGG